MVVRTPGDVTVAAGSGGAAGSFVERLCVGEESDAAIFERGQADGGG